ncbi:transporter substrate-binding domain-containing protein [Nisaea nitritireducens]|uniref:transporter substrate-binding domain-containing protein n=1 Tax=Nisaea nitritireducens TaxID=568392 RepID=UPI00186915AC|nr:transporter substrate-binding domain-containing protein [Nisaea nitritireducens]
MNFMKIATIGAVAAMAFTGAVEAKTYKVGLDGTFAPHAMPKLSGGVEGFNVDFANELGKRLGAEMDITAAQWSGLLPGMQAGTYDFLVAPTTLTEERSKSMLFSEGYLNTDFQFVVKKGAEEITDLKQFKGKVIAVNKGAVYDRWARELESEVGWKVESYGTNTDAIQAVISGRAFANVAGNTASAWAVKKNPMIALSYLHSTGKVFSVPFPKASGELRNMVDAAIECMKLDGTMTKLSEKWFGVTPAAGSAAITVQPGYGEPGFEGYDPTEHTPSCS